MSNEDDGRLRSDVAQYDNPPLDMNNNPPVDLPSFFPFWWEHHKSLRELIEDLTGEVKATREEVAALHEEVAMLQPQPPQPDGGLTQIKEQIMGLQVDVQNMVDQVARNTSLEESSALALAGLTARATSLDAQIADLQAQIAAGGTISPADIAAVQAASSALATSATHLQAAVPASTPTAPVAVDPVPPIPAPAPVDPNAPAPAGARGGRRF